MLLPTHAHTGYVPKVVDEAPLSGIEVKLEDVVVNWDMFSLD